MNLKEQYRRIRLWLASGCFISFFLFGLLLAIFFGWQQEGELTKKSQKKGAKRREAFAKDVNYYIYKDNKPAIHLDATELMINEVERTTIFYAPEGLAYSKDMTVINYTAKSGSFDERQERLHLKEDVIINTKTSEIKTKDMVYEMKADRVTCVGDVETKTFSEITGDTIEVNAHKVVSNPELGISRYYRNVKGKVSRKRKYEEPLLFDSSQMMLDLNESKVRLTGNVRIEKKTMKAKSHRGEIFLENYNKRLKYFVLYDDVQVKEELKLEGMPVVHRKAFAEKLEGIMSEEIYILTGFPKVFQDEDVIRGNRIVLRENNEVIEIDDVSTKFKLE